ncbi:unnamed protein product [Spirodela intermedia]|uniref:Uncharacterized protein n=1 Tax=Spirodela intermedia TaxID=51605 RepID=A0A7I8I8T5_SPIIN|nr:unnamed protein product [Spirodela intermedia]CAA6654077.1 unnamed protein product [Spirodela intermedia]
MAAGESSPATFGLLVLNLALYSALAIVAGWAINYGVEETAKTAFVIPARLFPIVYPIGNMATGFFVIFSLVAGTVGVVTSLAGLHGVSGGGVPRLSAAAAFALISWSLTLLAAGVACKEISIGWRAASLRTLETLSIVLSGTQLLCAGAIHAGLTGAASTQRLSATYGRAF